MAPSTRKSTPAGGDVSHTVHMPFAHPHLLLRLPVLGDGHRTNPPADEAVLPTGAPASTSANHGADVAPGRWVALIGHRAALVSLARSRGAGDDAEDVVHTALLRVVVRAELDHPDLLSYLRTTVINLCRDHHRVMSRRQVLARHRGLVPRPRDPVEHLCDQQEADAAVRELEELLPPEVMAVCHRVAARELTWQQAAAELNEPEPGLRSRVRRAYLRVRQRVRGWREQ